MITPRSPPPRVWEGAARFWPSRTRAVMAWLVIGTARHLLALCFARAAGSCEGDALRVCALGGRGRAAAVAGRVDGAGVGADGQAISEEGMLRHAGGRDQGDAVSAGGFAGVRGAVRADAARRCVGA